MNEGIYEQLINRDIFAKIKELNKNDNFLIIKEPLDKEEAFLVLSSYIEEVVRKALRFIREDRKREGSQKDSLVRQIEICNSLISMISEKVGDNSFDKYEILETSEMLMALYYKLNTIYSIDEKKVFPVRPATSIANSSLFTGSNKEPDLVSELRKEISSSDNIDMLVSFIKWSGLRLIYDELVNFVQKQGCRVRIITTCYMGATDLGAIEKLSQLKNVEIKISYDTQHTRLHAKSYLFQRNSGFTTAYIGSSNMSNAAMTSGLEWNLKITERDSFEIVRKFQATFENYWSSYDFETYKPNEKEHNKLEQALLRERNNQNKKSSMDSLPIFDIRPYAYQQDILDTLSAEREIFNRYKNLIVAATGVGKTIIAAFDFKNFYEKNKGAKLLFVAHREEILGQSMNKFRMILKDPNFGEIMTGNQTPKSFDHLFIMINSFNSKKMSQKISSDYYDYIIIDEFHHAAAKIYQGLLDHFKPKILLGLTATPERMDGKNILERFEDRIASEMRLAEAIDHKLLVPFHYFCVSDEVDLTGLKWGSNGYDIGQLTNIYHQYHKKRVKIIIDSMNRYLTDINNMKCLAFCVSVKHANEMEKAFNKLKIPAIVVTGKTDQEERLKAKSRLERGDINVIFTVDIYNEGVDIPEINTVMFLRPTASLTVFLQQLGRGLRHSEGKECLTVLDYVGRAHTKFKYEERFSVLLHKTKHNFSNDIIQDTLCLPRGCHIKMEKLAKDYILENLKNAIINKNTIISKIRTFREDSNQELLVGNFIDFYNIGIMDLYGRNGDRSLYTMSCEASGSNLDECYDINIVKRYKNLFFLDSKELLEQGINFFEYKIEKIENEKIEMMFYYSFFLGAPSTLGYLNASTALEKLRNDKHHSAEIIEILKYQYRHIGFLGVREELNVDTPLDVHCTYTTNQILAGIGYYYAEKMPAFREGVLFLENKKTDIFFVTLNKSEKDFSETTMYEDYPINEKLFHWQSQSSLKVENNTARRYINHDKLNHDILIFVRDSKKIEGLVSPFIFLGKCHYRNHSGSEPVNFIWEMETEMPARFLSDQLNLVK